MRRDEGEVEGKDGYRGPNEPESTAQLRRRWGLTQRQALVALSLLQGKTYREIAHELQISVHTVNTHVKAVLSKAGVTSRARLMASHMGTPRERKGD